ncbi:MAG: DinB family protein [Chloroflexi bacterium]|nr:MAG: DinB family protein [Chloroflexota bacterium]
MRIAPPPLEEYAPFYADYVQRAAARGDVSTSLSNQLDEIRSTLGALSDSQARFKPGPAEWSIKEVVSHLIDVERVFSYRFLRVSRKDKTPLPGFEQDDFVRESMADELPFASLLDEFESVRHATIRMVQNTKDSAFAEVGSASGAPISARALAYMIVGHVDHHMASLREKYLPAA